MNRDELIAMINTIVTDINKKLEALDNDDSDTAYELHEALKEAKSDFESAADYLDGVYDEVVICLNN